MNDILAKLSQNEKIYGVGAIVVAVGWLLGLVLTDDWYDASGAQVTGLLALVAAIGGLVVLYLKVAPGTNITWPMPVSQILLGLAAIAGVLALIGLLQAVTFDPLKGWGDILPGYAGPSKPIMLWIVVAGVVAGAGAMCYAAYMDWNASKK